MRPTVLVLTHSGDRYVVERVAEALSRRGTDAFRLDTDRFPSEVRLSARLGEGRAHRLRSGAAELDPGRVRAVWARKIWRPHIDERLDANLREGARRESAAALRGFLDGFHAARWIDPPAVVARAEDKLRQLRLAREAGLEVPETLLTNDPEAVRAFRAEHGDVVAKMLTPLSTGMERQRFFVRTSLVRDEDLEHLDGLRHAPMLFQPLVAKQVELRITWVGGRTFAGAIDASRSERGRVDWRLASPDEVRWERADVPDEIAARLGALMRSLGLRYGAADLIRTPEGRHVFLEVNPGGEWGMLERDLGLPIADAIAEALCAEEEIR